MNDRLMSWDGQRPVRGLRAALLRPRWSQIDWSVVLVAGGILGVGMAFLSAMAQGEADVAAAPFSAHHFFAAW